MSEGAFCFNRDFLLFEENDQISYRPVRLIPVAFIPQSENLLHFMIEGKSTTTTRRGRNHNVCTPLRIHRPPAF